MNELIQISDEWCEKTGGASTPGYRDACFKAVLKMYENPEKPETHDVREIDWKERYDTAPFGKFVEQFFSSKLPKQSEYEYCGYLGPVAKKSRGSQTFIGPIQKSQSTETFIGPIHRIGVIEDLISKAKKFVELSIPFLSNNPALSRNPFQLWNLKTLGVNGNFGTFCAQDPFGDFVQSKQIGRVKFEEMLAENPFTEEKKQAEVMYSELWKNIHDLSETSGQNCRSRAAFLTILREYQRTRTLPQYFCPNELCKQCRDLKSLHLYRQGQPAPNIQAVKEHVCMVEEQMRVFGAIICFGICPHLLKFNECDACMKMYPPCKKDSECVCNKEGTPLCPTAHVLCIDVCDHSFVGFHKNQACTIMRMCRDAKIEIESEKKELLFTADECNALGLTRPGCSKPSD